MCPAVCNMVPWPPQCSLSLCPSMWQKCCSIQRSSLYSGFSFGCFSADSEHKRWCLVEKDIQREFEDHEAMGFFLPFCIKLLGIKFPCIANVLFSVVLEEESSWLDRTWPQGCTSIFACSVMQPGSKTPHLVSSLYILHKQIDDIPLNSWV